MKIDVEALEIHFDESHIQNSTKIEHKKMIKNSIRKHVFSNLKEQQTKHSKIREICYKSFKIQDYLKCHILNNQEVSLLFSLRSKTAKEFKANFPYNQNPLCPMGCQIPDSQEHCLDCEKLNCNDTLNRSIKYEDIFSSDIMKQAAVTKLFASLLERREDASASPAGPSLCSGQDDDHTLSFDDHTLSSDICDRRD